MRVHPRLLSAAVVAVAVSTLSAAAPVSLTAEYRVDPVGIDAPRPRLAWALADGTRAQAAYELEIDGRAFGRVESSEHLGVAWPGAELASGARHVWRVRTWDQDGTVSDWSRPAEFTTGVMKPADWTAKWIGPNRVMRPDEDFGAAQWITAPADSNGVVTLRFAFDLAGLKPDAVADFVHVGVSQHEIDVNGKACHRWSGQIHDWRYPRFRNIAQWLKSGRNEVVVRILGEASPQPGDPVERTRVHAAPDERAFLAKLTLPDGRTLVTDSSWRTADGGPARQLGKVRETDCGRALILRTERESPAFARTFKVKGEVKSAVLHVTGVGFYEASLDGVKIGDKVLDPSPTAYDKRVLYSTYRLDGALQPGEHELSVLVGHGWYDMRSIATWNFDVAPWRDFPRALAQLDIVYADGSRETVATDASWRQVGSPVAFDCIAEGEVIRGDAARNPPAGKPVFAEVVEGPADRLVAEAQPGAKVMRTVAPKRIKALSEPGAYMIELPEMMAGWVRLKLRGQRRGDVVTIRYDERVDGDLEPAVASGEDGLNDPGLHPGETRTRRLIDCYFRYPASHRVCAAGAAFQTDRYLCSGAAEETYEPRFTYSGFRHVYVRGLAAAPRPGDVVGCVVHTAFETVGSFDCSEPKFMQLMAMADRSYRSNFADGIPTDCPHREKNGWTGDAWIASELAQYRYENTAAYEKWLRDLCDTQLPDGNVCCIVPTSGWGYFWGNGPSWDFALPSVAWNLWRYRGDRAILSEVYPHLAKYLAYTATRENADGLVAHGLGDWMTIDPKGMPSTELTSSCFYIQALRTAAAIAALEDRPAEAADYAARAEAKAAAVRRKFSRGNGVYDNGGQTAQAFPLAFGLVPEAEKPSVRARLVEAVEEAGGHLAFGVLGAKYVLRELSEAGRTDLAYGMLMNPTAPSPQTWIQKGATSLWEDWKDGFSRNHIMFGDFVAWAYQYLAGIRLESAEGSCSAGGRGANAFTKIVFAPQPIAALTHVSAAVEAPCGRIESAWRREGSAIRFTFTVPPGSTAVVRLPDGRRVELAAGTHTFVTTS